MARNILALSTETQIGWAGIGLILLAIAVFWWGSRWYGARKEHREARAMVRQLATDDSSWSQLTNSERFDAISSKFEITPEQWDEMFPQYRLAHSRSQV